MCNFVEIKTLSSKGGAAKKMNSILYSLEANSSIITLISISISFVSLILVIISYAKSRKLAKRYKSLMTGMDGNDLEEMLDSHLKTVNKIFSKTLEIESEYKATKKMAEHSLQRVGVVRYNAFDNTGSDLSFAIALLDYNGDGLVISGLFGRNETRTYAKPISQGSSTYLLSDEEQEAIKIAMNNK